MHIKISDQELERFLRDIKAGDKKSLKPSEFATLYRSLRKRRDVKLVFEKYATFKGKVNSMSSEELKHFFEEAQRETLTLEQCETIIAKFCTSLLDEKESNWSWSIKI